MRCYWRDIGFSKVGLSGNIRNVKATVSPSSQVPIRG